MPDLTVEEFINVVHRSQLIERDQLIDALSDCKNDGMLPTDPQVVAGHLRQKGLISEWQQRNLLLGKSRGFFLGTYRLLGHLGTGGMSTVFLAKHGLLDRLVAIKVLPATRVGDQSFLERFEREALATSRLSHPNIVRVFDIDQQDGTHYIVMEYVSGRDLKAIVKEEGPLPLDRAAHYIAQAAAGLQHANERGLVHRDIKPANLVVNSDDLLKVLDLGLARIDDDDELASLTVANAENMMGTADYLAPEQARNAHDVDHRADIYSLGCTFYFLLTGHAPFTEGTIAQRILKHQTEAPRDVRAERSDCPHALADVCMTMLAKDPADRLASGRVVAKRLHQWLLSNGFAFPSASYPNLHFDDRASQVPNDIGDGLSNDVGAGLNDEVLSLPQEQASLAEERRSRKTQRVKTPIGLWIFLAVSIVICVVLLIVVLLRG